MLKIGKKKVLASSPNNNFLKNRFIPNFLLGLNYLVQSTPISKTIFK